MLQYADMSDPHILAEFERWLPGELEYSAKKAGYPDKVSRAKRSPDDGRSMVTFLGKEWANFQMMRDAGSHHSDQHQITAQLQLAKLAAGYFDKVALGEWLLAGGEVPEDPDVAKEFFGAIGLAKGVEIVDDAPWQSFQQSADDFERTMALPFDDMVLGRGTRMMADRIANVADRTDEEAEYAIRLMMSSATILGGYATRCYEQYAATYLSADEFSLADSQLADPSQVRH